MGSTSQSPEFREHELKFLVPPARRAAVIGVLEALCIKDSDYPRNVVCSVYYDTPQLDSLHEKLNSDLFKTKIRVRWYLDAPDRGPARDRAFIEVKTRLGTKRNKVRWELADSADLVDSALVDSNWRDPLTALQSSHLPWPIAGLKPLLEVRYERRRYLDPLTGTRLSIDTDIQPGRVNASVLPHATPRALGATILEIKNEQGTLPHHLRQVLALGGRLQSFSKYFACFDAATTNTLSWS